MKPKVKKLAPAIKVRIRLRRPVFAALDCEDLKRENCQDGMTDNNDNIAHNIDT